MAAHPVRALKLSPRYFSDEPADEPPAASSPRSSATRALLSLCGQLEASSPRSSGSSPRGSPRTRGSPRGSPRSSPRFSPKLSPAETAGFAEERRHARTQLEGSFRQFYESGEAPTPTPPPATLKRSVVKMEEAAWAGSNGVVDRYWLLLRQAVSISVAEQCSPLSAREPREPPGEPPGPPPDDKCALKQRSPSAVQRVSDATPNRTGKRRKVSRLGGGGRGAAGIGISPGTRPGSVPWTEADDLELKKLVQATGTKWTVIGNLLKRTGKQCRERWCNHVDPAVNHAPWSDAEDRVLLRAQRTMGNQWVEIAKLLPGRPYNAVKNRFNKASLRHKFGRGGGAGRMVRRALAACCSVDRAPLNLCCRRRIAAPARVIRAATARPKSERVGESEHTATRFLSATR